MFPSRRGGGGGGGPLGYHNSTNFPARDPQFPAMPMGVWQGCRDFGGYWNASGRRSRWGIDEKTLTRLPSVHVGSHRYSFSGFIGCLPIIGMPTPLEIIHSYISQGSFKKCPTFVCRQLGGGGGVRSNFTSKGQAPLGPLAGGLAIVLPEREVGPNSFLILSTASSTFGLCPEGMSALRARDL